MMHLGHSPDLPVSLNYMHFTIAEQQTRWPDPVPLIINKLLYINIYLSDYYYVILIIVLRQSPTINTSHIIIYGHIGNLYTLFSVWD